MYCIYISTLFGRIFPKLVSNSNPTALLIIMCIQYSQHLYQQYTLSVNYPTAGLTHALITPYTSTSSSHWDGFFPQIWHKLIKKGKNWRKLRLAWIFFIVKNPPANFLPWHSSDWRNPEPTIFSGVAMLKADHWWLCLIVTLVLSVWLFTEDQVPQKE